MRVEESGELLLAFSAHTVCCLETLVDVVSGVCDAAAASDDDVG